ncbi:hypothetical protein Sjap_019402 [Stephania japonica]|uniref:AB hydrolase-1 domain-containing protein n=1 Tax=Stephania japonica TaxID=461633 RepID=A0AAP0HUP5_9MAGN
MVVCDTILKERMNARLLGCGGEDVVQTTVVLAHGFGANQSLWEKLVAHLVGDDHDERKLSVMLFDWSFSSAIKDPDVFDPLKYSSFDAFVEDLVALLDEMKLSSVVFVGHSISAMIGCLASIKRPDLFKKLFLIGVSPRMSKPTRNHFRLVSKPGQTYLNSEDYNGGFEMEQIEQILTAIETNFQAWASAFAPSVLDSKDPSSVDKFKESLSELRPEVALKMAKIIFCTDLRGTLEEVRVPCTIVQTTNDLVAPTSVAYYMQKKMTNAPSVNVEIIEADGHFPHLTNTNTLAEILDRALVEA